MRFSERYGYKEVEKALVREKIPTTLKNRLWGWISSPFLSGENYTKAFLIHLWDKFYKKDIDELFSPDTRGYTPYGKAVQSYFDYRRNIQYVKDWFFKVEWFEVFDFIEFLYENYPDKDVIDRLNPLLNSVLEEENLAYRIVDGIVTPLIDKEQIKEIEKALNPPDKFAPVREHIKNALKHLSDKKEPDYEGSIRESVHAVESLAKIITGKDKSLSGLIQSLTETHYNLREGFKELYNWSSKNLRHGKSGKELPAGFEEVIYMMVTCSAFVNYVIAKYGEGEIKGGRI